LAPGYGLTARERFPTASRRISKRESRRYAELSGDFNPLVVAHGNLCLQLCFDSLTEGLALSAMPAAAQLRIRFLRPVFVGEEVTFEVTSATEQPSVLLVEGECRARGATVAVVVARIPWPVEAAD
jgi:acyl dehydratase